MLLLSKKRVNTFGYELLLRVLILRDQSMRIWTNLADSAGRE